MKADFSLRISEMINSIDKNLAPVRALKKLSPDSSLLHESLFLPLEISDLAQLTCSLTTRLHSVRNLLKETRTVIEDIDPVIPDTSCQIISEINELKSKIDHSKPLEPLDYSKLDFSEPLTQAISKVPQAPS